MTANERKLLKLFRALSAHRQEGLLDYAEFLLQRGRDPAEPETPQTPLDLPRPEQESVVKAIKRLMNTYPMLDRNKLLHETSSHMAQHVIHKRPAKDVIDDLEALFQRYYREYDANRDN